MKTKKNPTISKVDLSVFSPGRCSTTRGSVDPGEDLMIHPWGRPRCCRGRPACASCPSSPAPSWTSRGRSAARRRRSRPSPTATGTTPPPPRPWTWNCRACAGAASTTATRSPPPPQPCGSFRPSGRRRITEELQVEVEVELELELEVEVDLEVEASVRPRRMPWKRSSKCSMYIKYICTSVPMPSTMSFIPQTNF